MRKIKICACDVETGGLELHHSLLTLYMCVLDDDNNVVDEIDLKLKPADHKIVFEKEAMDVNGIDLEEHLANPETLTYEEGREKFLEFCAKHRTGKRSLRPAGHNIADFDIPMIQTWLKISKEEWREIFHYRLLDTSPILTAMQDAGWLPEELGSQDSMVKYYGIKQLKSHVAKNDTLMWVGVYNAMLQSLRSTKNASASSSDELLILE